MKFLKGHLPTTPEEVPLYLQELLYRLEASFGVLEAEPPNATTTELTDKDYPVNTLDSKQPGYMVFNTTTSKPVYAAGSLNTSVWVDATGSTAHTPV